MADILARQRAIVGTTADWAAHNITLGDGELALERLDNGTVRAKVGNGVLNFSASPYLDGGSAAMIYRGNADPTAAPPADAVPGNLYSASPGGVVDASWGPPAAGQTVAEGDMLAMGADGSWNVIGGVVDLSGVVMETDLAAEAGGGMVGFTQTGIYDDGTVGRRLGDLPYSAKASPFFAEAAGDDTDALRSMAARDDDHIRININSPLRISGVVEFTDKNLSMEGNGKAASLLQCTGDAGIKFVSTPNSNSLATAHALTVRGLSFVRDEPSAAGAGPTAIEAEWGYTGSGNIFRASFDDICIRSNGPGNFWGCGIRLIDACRVHFNNIEIYNEDGWGDTGMDSAAINIVRDKASNLTGFFLTNFWLGQFANGILVAQRDASIGAGTVEGTYLNSGEIVNVAYAIHEDNDAGLADHYFDSLSNTNTHWNFSRAGFKSGRSRSINADAALIFCDNWGDPVAMAPLEGAFNILTESQALHVNNSHILRNSATTAAAPAFRLPTGPNLSYCRIAENQVGNWQYLAAPQSGGALTVEELRLYIGKNTLIGTPLLANYGWKDILTSVSGHADVASGAFISFGQTFAGAPVVQLTPRNGYVPNYRVDNLAQNGFNLVHDAVGVASLSWTATGQ